MATYSAPGKLMILGDHAVVFGQPCIASAVNRRIMVTAERAQGASLHIPSNTDGRFINATVSYFQSRTGYEALYDITTHAEFTDKMGFGSSSAVTVALLACLYDLWDEKVSEAELFNQAFEIHGGVQGNGSGFDIACAVHGGTIWYHKGDSHPEKLPNALNAHLVVCYSGIKAKTGPLVSTVQKKYLEDKNVQSRIKTMGELVQKARTALFGEEIKSFGFFCNSYQEHLCALGVSTPKLDALISAAREAGAWGAKLSGAGGGDCIFAVVDTKKRQKVAAALRSAGGDVVDIQLHESGNRKHS